MIPLKQMMIVSNFKPNSSRESIWLYLDTVYREERERKQKEKENKKKKFNNENDEDCDSLCCL
jgi:hypothetical protein